MNVNNVNYGTYHVAGKSTFKGAPVTAKNFSVAQVRDELKILKEVVSEPDGTVVNNLIGDIENLLAKISKFGDDVVGIANSKIETLNIAKKMETLKAIVAPKTDKGNTAMQSCLDKLKDSVAVLQEICLRK